MGEKMKYARERYQRGVELGSNPDIPVREAVGIVMAEGKKEVQNVKDLKKARELRKENVAKRLNSLREESGYRQKEVAEVIAVNTMTLSGYEIGKSEPNFEVLVRLADFYKVSLDYIFCRTDTKIPFDPEEHEAQDRERQVALDRIQQLETELANIKNSLQ